MKQVFYKRNKFIVLPVKDSYPIVIDAKNFDETNGFFRDPSLFNINQVENDLRLENLSKKKHNHIKKRARDPELSEQYGEIPRFIGYSKPRGGKEDRWIVEIKNIYTVATTTSKNFSTKCKFEAAKFHLRKILQEEDFEENHSFKSMKLLYSYIDIINLAGYSYKEDILKEDFNGISEADISRIRDGSLINKPVRKEIIKLQPENKNDKKSIEASELKKEYDKILKMKTEDIYASDKQYQLKKISFPNDDDYYKKLLFDKQDYDISKLDIRLEQVENTSQRNIFKWVQLHTSKLRSGISIGKNIKILVKDSISDKIIGIIQLSSDFMSLEDRDTFIGWSQEQRKCNINKNIMNLSCCVPVQPFGFNYTGGKLLVQLAFSREVFDMYYEKYNEVLLGINTTSINGKSIMYDRLKCLKFVGMTKGYGHTHIPLQLYEKSILFLKDFYRTEYDKISKGSSSKKINLQFLTTKINLNPATLFHAESRGIYFGYLFKNSKELPLSTKPNDIGSVEPAVLKNTEYIFKEWLKRGESRYIHLQETERVKTDPGMYFLENFIDTSTADKKRIYRGKQKEKLGNAYIDLESAKRQILRKSNGFTTRRENDNFVVIKDKHKFLNKNGYADIYSITNVITSKKYIGYATHTTGTDNEKLYCNGYLVRFSKHKRSFENFCKDTPDNDTKSNSALYGSMKKYGIENFELQCLISCKIEDVKDWEIYFIKEYNTFAPGGYNLTKGGDGVIGRKMSESNKEKLKLANLTETSVYYKNNYIQDSKNPFVFKRTNKEQLLYIISKKGTITTEEMSIQIKEMYKIIIPRNEISRLWKGEFTVLLPKEISDSQEYSLLLKNKTQRVYLNRKKKTSV